MQHPKQVKLAAIRYRCEESLLEFVKTFWNVVEPGREMAQGRVLEEMCNHLEAVNRGEITNILINVPPGAMKSLLVDCFFPAWEWGPRNMPHLRYVCASYSSDLTLRDNLRFTSIIKSELYQELWGDKLGEVSDEEAEILGHPIRLEKDTESKISNSRKGWKIATSVQGLGTGERGDRFIVDDPHNIKDAESEAIRNNTLHWWREVVPTRLNDPNKSSIIVIMQRVHEDDVSGDILNRELDYVHLMLPMRFDPVRACETEFGGDWREEEGELLWPERFNGAAVDAMEKQIGPYATASQFQQTPTTRGGNIIKQDWWKLYDMDYALKLGLLQDGAKKLVYPAFDLVVVSVDTALTEKKENCYSGCTVWGVWKDENNLTKIMLIYAWQDRLSLTGVTMPKDGVETETPEQRKARLKAYPGLVEKIGATARQWKAQAVIIENKANGADVINEIYRLFRKENWQLIPINPRGDKVARAYASVPNFTQALIYAPDKEWAQKVINQCASLPRGKDKDLADSAIQAILYLRETGIIVTPDEERDELAARLAPQGVETPLYPVY